MMDNRERLISIINSSEDKKVLMQKVFPYLNSNPNLSPVAKNIAFDLVSNQKIADVLTDENINDLINLLNGEDIKQEEQNNIVTTPKKTIEVSVDEYNTLKAERQSMMDEINALRKELKERPVADNFNDEFQKLKSELELYKTFISQFTLTNHQPQQATKDDINKLYFEYKAKHSNQHGTAFVTSTLDGKSIIPLTWYEI